MNKCGLLIVLALAAVGASSAAGSAVEQLCKGKTFELNTVGDIVPLIDALKAGQVEGCSEGVKGAVLDLESIVKADNVCSVEVARKIGLYYKKYISKKSKLYWSLSKSVREYFLAVGLEISKLCERTLMDDLNEVSDERIPKEDARELIQFNKKVTEIAGIIGGEDMQIQSLFVVTDLEGINSSSPTLQGKSQEAIAVDADVRKRIERIKSLCRSQFKPIYEKLISPLVILSNVGFESSSSDLSIDRDNFREGHGYQNWFRAVFICESTLAQKLVETPKSEQNDGDAMTILESEDLAKLNEETGVKVADEPIVNDVNELDLKVRLDPSTDLTSAELHKEIKNVNRKRKEAKEIRRKVLKRLMKNFEKLVESDVIRVGLPKKHWKKRALIWVGSIAMIVGPFTNPAVTIAGMALVFGLLFLRLFTTHDQWH